MIRLTFPYLSSLCDMTSYGTSRLLDIPVHFIPARGRVFKIPLPIHGTSIIRLTFPYLSSLCDMTSYGTSRLLYIPARGRVFKIPLPWLLCPRTFQRWVFKLLFPDFFFGGGEPNPAGGQSYQKEQTAHKPMGYCSVRYERPYAGFG
jgi:hypothetical protein